MQNTCDKEVDDETFKSNMGRAQRLQMKLLPCCCLQRTHMARWGGARRDELGWAWGGRGGSKKGKEREEGMVEDEGQQETEAKN